MNYLIKVKKKLQNLSDRYKFIYYLLQPLKYLYRLFLERIMPEKFYLAKFFKSTMGYELPLTNPKTLNEKIQWLKLYDRTELHTICADKFLVRGFILREIGEKYLVPLILETKDFNKSNVRDLPNYPFILKANHDSGSYIIIRDKKDVDWSSVVLQCNNWLKENYYYKSKEWQYKNIKPRIVVEKLLMQKNGKIPYDYKAHCINGKVEMVSVDIDRGSNHHFRNWYDPNWNRLPFKWSSILVNGHKTDPSDFEIEKPKTLQELIRCSEVLSKHFCYVRVDWYEVDGCLYFGELTFHHDGGFRPIEPKEWDLKLGEKVIFPK